MRICFSALALSTATLLTACEANPVGTSEPSRFMATIEGSISADFQGSGYFSNTTQRRPAAPPLFMLRSHGLWEVRDHGLEFTRTGSELPAVGSYVLGPQNGMPAEFNAVYSHRQGNMTHRYSAQSGELQITASSPQRIEGTFRFTGVLNGICISHASGGMCTLDPTFGPEAPAVEVHGSFEAIPERLPR